MLWPILLAIFILGLAYLVFYMAPVVLEFGKSFLIVIAAFLVLFAGAATYIMYSLPGIEQFSKTQKTSGGVSEIVVTDTVVR
ncbi:MAG: hypothetical protein WC787_00750 [Patescibacteria group bacterium]